MERNGCKEGVTSPKTSELEIIIGRMHFATGIPA